MMMMMMIAKNKGRCNSSHKVSRNWFAALLENKTIVQQKLSPMVQKAVILGPRLRQNPENNAKIYRLRNNQQPTIKT